MNEKTKILLGEILNRVQNGVEILGPKKRGNKKQKKNLFKGIYADNQLVDGVTVLPEGIMNENQ